MPARARSRVRLLSLFILLHLYAMVFWGLPRSNFRSLAVSPVEGYVSTIGLWHSWDMFSPDPLAVVVHVQARIRFQDGSSTTWHFPRMEELGLWERFQKERYRKLRERLRLDAYANGWDDLARHVARLHDTPHNRPVQVILTRLWEPIPPPTRTGGRPDDYQPRPARPGPLTNQYDFHRYTVRPEDL